MRALVRRPSPRLADGLVTHIERQPIDLELATKQWDGYVAALEQHGWDIVELEPTPDCPDGVFVEDTAVMFGEHAVICHPGAEERRPEVATTAAALTAIGRPMTQIVAPGFIDGGDVLKVGSTVYVGRSGRTNQAAIDQLATAVEVLGYQVVAVPLTKVLHLKSAVTALPDGTVIGYEPLVDDAAVFPSFQAMPEEAGAHVVLLGGDHVMVSTSAPKSIELLESMGWTPVPVDMSEYEKLEGCVTCLSIRIRTASARQQI